jgi:hypothetical protein
MDVKAVLRTAYSVNKIRASTMIIAKNKSRTGSNCMEPMNPILKRML